MIYGLSFDDIKEILKGLAKGPNADREDAAPSAEEAPTIWLVLASALILALCLYITPRLFETAFGSVDGLASVAVSGVALVVGVVIAAKAWSSARMNTFACKLRAIARTLTATYKSNERERAPIAWTIGVGILLFALISSLVDCVFMYILQFNPPHPWENLPVIISIAIGAVAVYVLYTRWFLDGISKWAKSRDGESRVYAAYKAQAEAQRRREADIAAAAAFSAMADAINNSEPSTPWYAEQSHTSSDSSSYSSPASNSTWDDYQRKQNESFHRHQAEQAEYGGYSADAQYHRNMQRNYRG